ncbi:MAG: ATP-grasp domain-containing protein [Eubacteriaceae bacterium]
MRLLILGGGNNQLNGIIRSVQKGHEVVLTDYYKDAPGRTYAKYNETISTFDVKGNIDVAKKYSVDGVMTLGTDQPVYTVAEVAKALNLPRFLDVDTAAAVTNKKIMKTVLSKYNIPTVKYKLINESSSVREFQDMNFPVVLKPLDSQGQRGVYKLNSIEEIYDNILNTLKFSRKKEALLEEFYKSDEITVSCWVEEGKPYILTVTDRETFNNDKHIGICFAHNFPSKFLNHYYKDIKKMVNDITKAFNIKNGPLYIQLLVGEDGIYVNELACRIGGAYEDVFIPYLTDFDILDRVIDYSLGRKVKISLDSYSVKDNLKQLSVQLFFASVGRIKSLTPVQKLYRLPGVISASYNISKGKEIKTIKDATQRAGHMIITGKNKEELALNIDNAFEHLKIIDDRDKNLSIQVKKYKEGD